MRFAITCSLWVPILSSSLYFKYPDNVGPDSTQLNFDGSDYLVTSASVSLPTDVIENYSRDELLERYKLSDNYIGFVFDGSATIQQVVKSRIGTRGTGNIKLMKTMDVGWTYYELRPLMTNNTVYIDKFFDFEELPGAVPGEEWCMLGIDPGRANPEEYCRKFPRCLGVLQHTNKSNVCLVGNAAITRGGGTSSTHRFVGKKLRHDIFVTMGENGVLLGVITGLAVAAQILVPFGLNTSVISRVTGRLRRADPGDSTEKTSKVSFFGAVRNAWGKLFGGKSTAPSKPVEAKARVKARENNYDF
jgi:hypothetical protein